MAKVLLGTSGLFALINSEDTHHKLALSIRGLEIEIPILASLLNCQDASFFFGT